MPVRFTELEALVTANVRDFERGMDRAEDRAESAARSIQKSFKGDPFKDFDKNIAKIDRQLKELERPRELQFSTRKGRNEMGQFIEAIAQGDPGELLGQIAQSGGKAGIAIAGVTLAAAAAAVGIAAMTARMIDLVRETDKLAKDSKLTSQQIQGLQIVANLTGESIEDLAENYKKIGPEVKRFEDLVKSSGAAIDDELRIKTQSASLAWEELKVVSQGALNAIARELLPVVTDEIGRFAAALNGSQDAMTSLGRFAGETFSDISVMVRTAIADIGLLVSGLNKIGSGDFRAGFSDLGGALRGTINDETVSGGVDFNRGNGFPNVPSFKKSGGGSRGGSRASDADAARRAELDLLNTQAQQALTVEQKRIDLELDAMKRSHDERLRFIGDNLNAEIDEFNRYYNERTALQERSIDLEIDNEVARWHRLEAERKKAQKQSEKLRLDAEMERVSGRLDILRLEKSAIAGDEGAARARDIKKAQEEQHKTARELASAYKDLQADLVNLNGSEYDQFLQNLQRTTAELQTLATITNNQKAFDLLRNYTQAAKQQFKLTHSREMLGGQLDLKRDQILQQRDLGLLTEGQARREILQVETRIGEQLRENLRQQIAIAESQGREIDALRLRQQLEEANTLGVDRERIQRLKNLKGEIGEAFDGARQAIVTGQMSVLDAAKSFALNLGNTFLNELEVQMIRAVTGGKYDSLGQALGDLIGGWFNNIFNKVNPAQGATGDPIADAIQSQSEIFTESIGEHSESITEALSRQTESLTKILSDQVAQSAQALQQLTDLANCSCQPAPQEGFWSGLAKAAISGAVSGAVGGLTGGALGSGGGGGEGVLTGLFDEFGNRIPARARGGPVKRRRPYMVGEAGMEMFVPQEDGYIVPNHRLAEAASPASMLATAGLPTQAGGGKEKSGISTGMLAALSPAAALYKASPWTFGLLGAAIGGKVPMPAAFGLMGALFGGKRASGGPVEAGKAYLTGELGEEMYVPSVGMMTGGGSSVNVSNNQKTVVVHQYNTFNIKTEGGQVTRATFQQIAAQNAAAAKHALERIT